ncbi:MAG: phage tail tape measure protein, partial [Muribaculaceae bacterium]|nr:phage tail tape measure protein [Muribaculaceae bacterium]
SLNLKMQEEIKASNKKLAQLTIEVATDMTEQAGNGDNNGPSGSAGGTGKTSGAGKKDKFAVEKDWRESQEALLRIDYATGVRDYVDYIGEMDRIAVEFCEKQLAHTDLTELERLKITADWRDAQKKQQERFDADTIEQENVSAAERKAVIIQAYIDGEISKASYDIKIEEAEIEHQRRLVSATKEGTRDRAQAEQQLQSLLLSQSQRRQQEREKLEAKYAAMKKSYFGDNPREAQSKLDDDLDMLKIIYDREIEAAGENAAEKLRIDEAYEQAKLALKKKYGLEAETDTRNAMQKAVAASAEWLQSDGGKAVTGSMDTLVSGMSAIFSQLSSGIQAELEMQTASVNKRYDAELSRAEGNAYRIRQIEKRKEKELAQLKSDANRKMFAMQVIQAVAQTATNALNAYGSAAAIPVVGLTMAPIAAAAAVAAGMMQVAAIRKQQAASEAQGYAEGGFTRPGRKYEPAGIVHAGEWVASQTLVNNPATRPLIEALDYAQRTNTVGRLAPADVSGSPAVPVIRSRRASGPAYAGGGQLAGRQGIDADLADVIRRLAEKLDEPFVTVNTMTGDHGILETERRYERLMRNKNPKNR